MRAIEYKLKTSEEQEIQVYEWLPDNDADIVGLLQIAHGMAEHGKRYTDFAGFLTANGYAVYANDHRGHGKTAGKVENLGFIAPKNGWDAVVSDMKVLSTHVAEKHPGKPFFIMGHSMGSFLTRKYLEAPPFKPDGAILSGTAGNPGILGGVGRFLTSFLMLFNAPNSPSKLMDKLSFGAYNTSFKPNRTAFDWLSRDHEQVDKYVDDPYCGTVFSLQFFNDMLGGLIHVSKQANIDKTAEDLPLYIFSGEKDPVGTNGKGVTEVYEKYKKAGIKNVTLKLYKDGRHEMVNEINRDEVYKDILNWLNNQRH